MAQPQPQMPARPFSPQLSPSPSTAQSGFNLPPNKRAKMSPVPASQPESPYTNSPYGASPAASVTPNSAAASPQYSGNPPTSNLPYTNGHTTTNLPLPEGRPQVPTIATPQPPTAAASSPYTVAAAPIPGGLSSAASPSTPGAMGPPSRPPERPTKEYEYDVTDSLAGTGIDIRAEEQYMAELHALDPQGKEARTGFQQHPPGAKSTFYGAGPLNQPPQATTAQTQNELVAQNAEKAWTEASTRLALTRTQELNDPFLLAAVVHHRAEKIAKEYGIVINAGLKNAQQPQGRMRLPQDAMEPRVQVSTKTLPDGAVVQTTGSWIPHDAFLADQLSLLSIASKLRLRQLTEDALRAAVHRQATSHGDIPEEWAEAAAPLKTFAAAEEDAAMTVPDSAVSPRTNPLKRPSDDANLESTAEKSSKLQKVSTNSIILGGREAARSERDWEERRLRSRMARKEGTADQVATPSRAGSAAPGTPGLVAPDVEKAPPKKESKKEQRRKAAATAAEASSHANQNQTSSMFAGLGSAGSLFGRKKNYDWMNAGRSGSGANTPTRVGTPVPGKPSGPAAPPPVMSLTTDGRNRLGNWREDKEKGKGVQLRDWIVALEEDGLDGKALQSAYDALDSQKAQFAP